MTRHATGIARFPAFAIAGLPIKASRSPPSTAAKLLRSTTFVTRVPARCPTERFPLTAKRASSSATMSLGDVHNGPVGFIGLGIMGGPMARNLLTKADRKLIVWNRDVSKSAALQKDFPDTVVVATSPKEVIETATLTYSMLSTPEAVSAVFHDEPLAALSAVSAGKCIVDCSTLTEEASKKTSAAVASKGGYFLEAPVSGSKVPAETGTLIFLCGGSKELFDAIVKSDLEAMGKKSFHLSDEVGAGTRMKLVVNQLMGSMLAAFGEGMTLAEAAGLKGDDLIEVLSLGAMNNPMFNLKGPKMKQGVRDYAPHFPLEHAQKDMRFAGMLAEELQISMPVAAAANETFKAAKAEGRGREDFSAVIEAIRRTKE
eukprot:CAMPEP_0198325946 /NCGR_PEP_ID=MMETSP1450-20131203/13575_1 /TAXON_ID=753684 ORGANISM="Madagascaria erythrocladiodes, Strain CCMP3234" /NCGR_SAMPLE_ID=MMETSP1450 /ASSEMBLY_ACC=CAM_ASM_001115 /LENGTH=371 /DNA_ID=CAMNT_0044029877 /DNA_START=134 /DNA_END=1249 /DNA_ORIENTATION=-